MTTAWVTPEYVRERWSDAPLDDDVLNSYIDAAQFACEAFAPVLADGVEVPESYRLAVVAQARSIYRSVSLGNQDGGIGPDGFAIQTFPLDWTVKQFLRPKNPRPVIA
jgi:hypothetical protein